uniref:Taste 1 receptor member 1 n=1 Tax=Buteo japonicus TaxID=224669 RepID=A0A8B9ZAV4_9AVES
MSQNTESPMLDRFESWKMAEKSAAAERACSPEAGGGDGGSAQLYCTQRCTGCHLLATAPNTYDAQASFNVYSAVYAVAHGLHDLLGCASGACSKGKVYPWQLLRKIKQVNFTLYKSRISFDANGDICKGYDIITWDWSGPSWAFNMIGTFRVNPDRLSIDQGKIPWHTKDRQVLGSARAGCSAAADILPGSVVCEVPLSPPGLLSSADLYSCQSCRVEEWAPARSEACFNRTAEFLSWSEPISWALLIPIILLMLLMAGLAVLFALNASTPVVKSAGGKMCFLMLGSLACAGSSLFCYFGEPTRQACLLQLPLFAISFTVFLLCVATRSFQIICIFKLNARWPALYEAWLRRRGPVLFVAADTATQAVLRVVIAYTVLLSVCCFVLSYAGKDLPASYNEAKCLTCSLFLHLACAAVVLCTQGAFRGREAVAVQVLGTLCTLGALLGGYFLPKAFVILLRPRLNTPEHFQMAIQSYTRRLAEA